jgi:hypothetical protein
MFIIYTNTMFFLYQRHINGVRRSRYGWYIQPDHVDPGWEKITNLCVIRSLGNDQPPAHHFIDTATVEAQYVTLLAETAMMYYPPPHTGHNNSSVV